MENQYYRIPMEERYCKVTNELASFKLRCVTHEYNKANNELNLIVRVNTTDESEDFMNYVRYFSEAVTGVPMYKQKLVSDVVISNKDGNESITFKGCMLISINFPEELDKLDAYNYEIMMTFKEGHRTKKLYLSGPMSLCKDEATWKANFQRYEDFFTEKGYIVVNPAKNEILPTYEECLKHSLQQEMECDCIFFMENAILSTGARLEYEIAKACGIEIIVLDDDISLTDNYENKSGIKCKNN